MRSGATPTGDLTTRSASIGTARRGYRHEIPAGEEAAPPERATVRVCHPAGAWIEGIRGVPGSAELRRADCDGETMGCSCRYRNIAHRTLRRTSCAGGVPRTERLDRLRVHAGQIAIGEYDRAIRTAQG